MAKKNNLLNVETEIFTGTPENVEHQINVRRMTHDVIIEKMAAPSNDFIVVMINKIIKKD